LILSWEVADLSVVRGGVVGLVDGAGIGVVSGLVAAGGDGGVGLEGDWVWADATSGTLTSRAAAPARRTLVSLDISLTPWLLNTHQRHPQSSVPLKLPILWYRGGCSWNEPVTIA